MNITIKDKDLGENNKKKNYINHQNILIIYSHYLFYMCFIF